MDGVSLSIRLTLLGVTALLAYGPAQAQTEHSEIPAPTDATGSLPPPAADIPAEIFPEILPFNSPQAPRPPNWHAHYIEVADTRYPVDSPNFRKCPLEIYQVDYNEPQPAEGVVMLDPGLFQNDQSFNIDPEHGISTVNWLIKEKHLKVYVANNLGSGHSCYFSKSNIDDNALAMQRAIRFIAAREKQPIIALGESMGGIALQAAAAGISRCADGKACFDAATAAEIQSHLQALGVMGANVGMTSDHFFNHMKFLAWANTWVGTVAQGITERIPMRPATRLLGKLAQPFNLAVRMMPGQGDLGQKMFWRRLFSSKYVKDAVRIKRRLVAMAFEPFNLPTVLQYADAYRHQGLRTSSGQSYAHALANIQIPFVQSCGKDDPFSQCQSTKRDDFDQTGTPPAHKHLFNFIGGHEDPHFILGAADADPVIVKQFSDFIDCLKNNGAC